jgi:hypothetical protein
VELERYLQCLRELVAALDARAEPEHVERLGEESSLRCEALRIALGASTPLERAQLGAGLAQARRWAAVAAECSQRAKASVAERLGEVARARLALAQVDGTPAGASCDIRG